MELAFINEWSVALKTWISIFILLILALSLALTACNSSPTSNSAVSSSQTNATIATFAPSPSPNGGVLALSPLPATSPSAPTVTNTPLVQVVVSNTPTLEVATPTNPPTATLSPAPATPTISTSAQPNLTKAPASTTTSPKTTAAATSSAKTATTPPTLTPRPVGSTTPYTGPLSEVVRGKTGKKEVAITLDAGAGAEPFPKMLTALDKAGVKITFFLTGSWAQQNPAYVQQIVNSGHEIANHTWSHPDLTGVSDAQIKDELERTDALLSRFTGHSTRPLWRAPYGSRNARVMSVVNGLGYRSIFWTLDSLDSVGQPKSARFLIDRITGQTNAQLDGQIILMHIGNATTADALPAILQNLQERGFKVVPVSELLS